MTDEQNQISHLQRQLDDLQKRQELFQTEITRLREELGKLPVKVEHLETVVPAKEPVPSLSPSVKESVKEPEIKESKAPSAEDKIIHKEVKSSSRSDEKMKSDIERFIGENLINKIGIVITVIGVGIGAKYAIDHQLISPLTRIILGYLVGLGLFFFAFRLREQYLNFSAVLLSGSMAIMYLITYLAFSLYSIFPQSVAFILMVIFTAMTVTGALRYDREIIAIVGMVGAFAIPYLLSEGSENVTVFFSYVAFIDIGILIIAVKKYWKPLYFSAFVFTWLIYFTWFFARYKPDMDFTHGFVFLLLFFIIFYLTFLSYKLIRKEKFNFFDILLLLANSFIFYGVGYSMLKGHMDERNVEGLFTLGNALLHALISVVIYRNRLADKNLFYLVSGLAVVFLTITIPVQLNGSWVTLFWICEAAVLISIGRYRNASIYEKMSYALLGLAILSQIDDWNKLLQSFGVGGNLAEYTPVFNISFISALLFIAAFTVFIFVFFSKKYSSPLPDISEIKILLNYLFSGLFILMIYLTFMTEINAHFKDLLAASNADQALKDLHTNTLYMNIIYFKKIWLCNYSLLFLALLSAINSWKIRESSLGLISFWLIILTICVFLSQSLFNMSELRENYLMRSQVDNGLITGYNIIIRYISFAFVSLSFLSLFFWIRKENESEYYRIVFSLFFHLALLWILCSEMLNILDLVKSDHSYKFGLSILTGLYALMLIVLGITGKKSYLRIAAMVLLGATLVKLFFYDITRLDTILKTILFLAMGILFLLISFLYNKYKVRMFGAQDEEQG